MKIKKIDLFTDECSSNCDTLVLCDFDGTLTIGDTLFPFLRECRGSFLFLLYVVVASPWLIGLFLKKVDAQRAKEVLLSLFLKGWSEKRIEEYAEKFFKNYPFTKYCSDMHEQLTVHASYGHTVILVSASPEIYVKKFAEHFRNAIAIGTLLEFSSEGEFKGKIKGRNCNYDEKVRRIRNAIDVESFSHTIAYGNSDGDMPMLKMVKLGFLKVGEKWLKV